ncbi:hypothetical protein I4U23_025873 [Adineta vaga]|nr:hypothetical protein I4U23_025873 [Adineta vaga]
MNYPTGMSAGTGMHYNKVASQMQNYLHSSSRRSQYAAPAYGQYFPQGEAIASHLIQYGAQRMGVPPMVANEISGMAFGLMRNVLS